MPLEFLKLKNFFLTYQHLESYYDDKAEALAGVKELCEGLLPPPVFYSIGIEDYNETDGLHAHVLLEYGVPTSIRASKLHLCALGTIKVPFNQTISHSRVSVNNTRKYCLKDGCTFSNYTAPNDTIGPTAWANALSASTRAEADAILRENFPQKYICCYSNIQSFLNGYYVSSNIPYNPPPGCEAFTIPDDLIDGWVIDEFTKVNSFDLLNIDEGSINSNISTSVPEPIALSLSLLSDRLDLVRPFGQGLWANTSTGTELDPFPDTIGDQRTTWSSMIPNGSISSVRNNFLAPNQNLLVPTSIVHL